MKSLFYVNSLTRIFNSCGVRFRCTVGSLDTINTEKKFNSLNKVDRRKFNFGFNEEGKTQQIATRILISVVGNGAIGQPRCLCLFTEYRSYMFNCGEGSIRLTREYETLLAKIRHIFITQRIWENLAGIGDIYLSNQIRGIKRITLHGPPKIDDFNQVLYSYNKDLYTDLKGAEDSPFENDTLKVEYVPILHMQKRNHSKSDPLPNVVFSYICEIKAQPGQLLFEKCIEHGITGGQDLYDLKYGKEVTLPSGKKVTPEDVSEPHQPAIVILVVDCPYDNMLDDFVWEQKFSPYYSPSEKSQNVYAVFHFTPPHIVLSYKYQQWMSRFHKSTKHVLLNELNSTLSSRVVHQLQYTLHELHPRMYPLLQEGRKTDISELFCGQHEIIQADPMLQFHLKPQMKVDRNSIPKLNPEEFVRKAQVGFGKDLSNVKMAIEAQENSSSVVKSDYPEVIFLGTCSSNSSPYRNVSVILVNIDENRSILLDCGEGGYMQFVRYFGPKKVNSALKKICCIFLSHHHNDHYLGIFRLLKARREAFLSSFEEPKQAALLYTYPLIKHFADFQRCFGSLGQDVKFFFNARLSDNKCHDNLKPFIGDKISLLPVQVIHAPDSYGLVIEKDDWKIVYSGDAAPSQSLIDAGKDCTLLIHEASIEDNFSVEAAVKRHSTPSQVVEIAEQMNAKCTILTHFSKRYLAVPVIPQTETQFIGCAFDNMSVRLHELPFVPLFIPCFKNIFSEELEDFYEKSISSVHFENVFHKKRSKMDNYV